MRSAPLLLACSVVVSGCVQTAARTTPVAPSPYLLIFAADMDEAQEDFLAVVDVRPGRGAGKVVATRPVGMKASMPHHMEYHLPPPGELLFMNAHHHEQTLLVDTADPLAPRVVRRLTPPAPFRFMHDYWRLPNGNRLTGFLRSDGPSPKAGDDDMPGNHGGIAEYTAGGELIRTASAAVASYPEPIRPYAFAPLLAHDRVVTTAAAMMEDESADVVQVWRYSDFKLLHTLEVPPALSRDGTPEPRSARLPFEPRVMFDGSVLFNTYGCAFYRVTDVAGAAPRIVPVHLIDAPEPSDADDTRGACGVPVVAGRWWVMPVGRANRLVTYDVDDPANPREVSRLAMPNGFKPHWSAKDPCSDRIVVGAELGGEQGMFIVRLDPESGQLRFDESIRSAAGQAGYIDLAVRQWPHGESGPAWAHAALFMPRR